MVTLRLRCVELLVEAENTQFALCREQLATFTQVFRFYTHLVLAPVTFPDALHYDVTALLVARETTLHTPLPFFHRTCSSVFKRQFVECV